MKFRLMIDPNAEEEVVARVHNPSVLTEQIEQLVMQHTGSDRLQAWTDEDVILLSVQDIACITVLNGKTFAIDHQNCRYRLKQRLYELEEQLPSSFIRINKSSLANEAQLERFRASFNGSVDAVFKCGYAEYVSRRCFAQIKRRYQL